MYIDPFWAGVISTVFIELLLIIVSSIIFSGKEKKE